jgi:hypothetical protein
VAAEDVGDLAIGSVFQREVGLQTGAKHPEISWEF